MNPKEVMQRAIIEPDWKAYASFYEHAWAEEFVKSLDGTNLMDPVWRFCLSLKGAANFQRQPWMMVEQVRHATEGFWKTGSSIAERTTSGLRLKIGMILREHNVRNMVTTAIDTDIERAIKAFHDDEGIPADILDDEGYWRGLLNITDFAQTVHTSQGLCYCSLFFAYEHLLTSCWILRNAEAAKEKVPYTSQDKFWKSLPDTFERDYWKVPQIELAREVRNSIAHWGGIAKKQVNEIQALLPKNELVHVGDDGFISILPRMNARLYGLLKAKAVNLVNEIRALTTKSAFTSDS